MDLDDMLAMEAEMQQESASYYHPMDEDINGPSEEDEIKRSSQWPVNGQIIEEDEVKSPSQWPVNGQIIEEDEVNKPAFHLINPKSATKSVEELAMQLKEERKIMLEITNGKNDGKSSTGEDFILDKPYQFVTIGDEMTNLLGRYTKSNNQKYLFKTPKLTEIDYHTVIVKNYCTRTEAATSDISDGQRFFLRDYYKQNADEQLSHDNEYDNSKSHLLNKSMQELYAECEEIKLRSLMHNENIAQTAVNEHSSGDRHDHDLWVNKYKPRSFVQLLSPEKVNREVMRALKRWDHFVFKKPLPNNKTGNDDPNTFLEEDLRPKKKVILLAGPPGTGKSTLAAVLAEQCGYQSVEVNASDDRSPALLRDVLQRATQSHTLSLQSTSHSPRPNCIILDEMDGADSSRATLQLILEMLRCPLKPPQKANKSSAKSQSFPLTRPLICICNDQHTPLLRELRQSQLCEVFVLPRPIEQRFVNRLREIYTSEQQHHLPNINNSSSSSNTASLVSPAVLQQLSAATNFDIRAALNYLQLISQELWRYQRQAMLLNNNNTSTSRAEELYGNIVRDKSSLQSTIQQLLQSKLKDMQPDTFQLLRKLFYFNSNSSNNNNNNSSSSSDISCNLNSPVNSLLVAMDAVSEFDDFSQLTHAIHENILHFELGLQGNTSNSNNGYNKYQSTSNRQYSQSSYHAIHSIMQRTLTTQKQQQNNINNNNNNDVLDLVNIPLPMHRLSLLYDQLSCDDQLSTFIYTNFSQDMLYMHNYHVVLAGYLHYCYALHGRTPSNTSANTGNVFAWPKKDLEMHYQQQQRINILTSLRDTSLSTKETTKSYQSTQAIARARLTFDNFAVDVISPLQSIISPTTRSLSLLSMSANEVNAIHHAVAAMEAMGLVYIHQGHVQGQSFGQQNNQAKNMNNKSNYNNYNNNNNNGKYYNKYNNNNSEVVSKYVLEPDIHLFALNRRNRPINDELKEIIISEQKKSQLIASKAKFLREQENIEASTSSSRSATTSSTTIGHAFTNKVSPTKRKLQDIVHSSNTPTTIAESISKVKAPEQEKKMVFGISGFFQKLDNPNKKARSNETSSTNDIDTNISSSSIADSVKASKIYFKFNHGFSNAVKRKVYLNEFIENFSGKKK